MKTRMLSDRIWFVPAVLALLAGVALGLLWIAEPATPAVAAPSAAAGSTTVYVPAVADATLFAHSADTNGGTLSQLLAEHMMGGGQVEVCVFLVKLDLGALPEDVIIDSAVLELYRPICVEGGSYPVSLGAYFVNSLWQELTVTWNSRPSWESVGMSAQVPCPNPATSTSWNVTSFARARGKPTQTITMVSWYAVLGVQRPTTM